MKMDKNVLGKVVVVLTEGEFMGATGRVDQVGSDDTCLVKFFVPVHIHDSEKVVSYRFGLNEVELVKQWE